VLYNAHATLKVINVLLLQDRFAFLSPPLGDLGATYDDHLRLVGKRVGDFL